MVAPIQIKSRFKLGQLVATPGAIAVLQRAQQDPLIFIQKHRSGDWGEVDAHDKQANDNAVSLEGHHDRQERVLSSYRTTSDDVLWVITEADRSATTLLTPDEY